MTPMLFVGVALAGGLGAGLRFAVDAWIKKRHTSTLPLGTMAINISGSFLIGAVAALALGGVISEELRLALGVGLLGGYTTFSTASIEAMRLLEQREHRASAIAALGTLVLGTLSAAIGWWLVSLGV